MWQVVCWIKGDMLHMRQTSGGKGSLSKKARETFPLTLWNVEPIEKDKFALVRPGGQQVRMRADSADEAELWVRKLTESMRKAKKEASTSAQQHAMVVFMPRFPPAHS